MIPYKFSAPTPYESKDVTPLGKVEICSTPYTVKSLGLELSRYVITGGNKPDFSGGTNLTLIDSGVTPMVGFYYGSGAPPGFSASTRFAYKYTGYFYARTSNAISFSAIGHGYVAVEINSVNVFGNVDNETYTVLDPLSYEESAIPTSSLVEGNFYAITIYYYSLSNNSGFALLWKNSEFWGDDADNYNQGLPVTAGVTSAQDSFLTEQSISGISKISVSQGRDEASTMKFEVPLGTEGGSGYYYDNDNDWYVYNGNSSIKIKRGWYIQGFVGYESNTGSKEYVKKFTGNIDKITPKRQSNKETLMIECIGFENFLKTSINLNYPDVFDYWISGYTGSNYNYERPEGIHMPTTFDGWELTKSIQALMIRAYIDPSLFIEKRQFLDSSDTAQDGSFLMERATPSFIYLDRGRNYGQPFLALGEKEIDTSYILESNFGDDLLDYINKIVDTYGWQWGFADYYDGAPFLKPLNNPTSIKYYSDGTTNTDSDWSDQQYDIDAIKGEYIYNTTADDYIDFSFKGKRVDAVPVLFSDGGITSTVQANSSTTEVIVTTGAGSNFSAGQRVVVQFGKEEESSVIQSISSDTLTVSPAFSRAPVSSSYIRTATYSAEVRRGTSWSTATSIETTYGSCDWDSADYKSLELLGWDSSKNPTINSTNRFYYQGIDPRIAKNPCRITVGNDLTYDDHIIRFTRLGNSEVGSNGKMGINAIYIYDNDPIEPLITYRTGDSVISGSVISLDVADTGKNLRNDTIVVGRRIGVETPGVVEDGPINPNNPYNRHITSRAMDLGSIMNSGTSNFVGRPLQTIQIAPEIASENRADYWASTFINRYREPERSPSFKTICNPLLEIGDCIALSDESREVVKSYDKLWVESIQTDVSPTSIIDTVETTSYEPWFSYEPRPQVDISNFGGKIIDNLTILQSRTQKSPQSDNPYDPYSSQEYDSSNVNNLIEIAYDLNIDADIRIDIVHESGVRVATLLNPAGEDQGWARQTVGKGYKVTWDGVDQFGDWNKQTPLLEDGESTIAEGFYVAEMSANQSSERFFVRFTIRALINSDSIYTVSSHLDFSYPYDWIHTKRGTKVRATTENSPFYAGTTLLGVSTPLAPPPNLSIGFFSDDNIHSNQDAGLRIGVKSTNSLRRPSQLVIDVDAILFGVSHVTLSRTNIVFPQYDLTVNYSHPFSTVIRDSWEFNEFEDRSDWFNFYYEPTRMSNLSLKRIDPKLSSTEAVEEYKELTGYDLTIVEGSYTIDQQPYLSAWYFKFTVSLIDLSGRNATSTVYHRWDGLNKDAVSDTTGEYNLSYIGFYKAWGDIFGDSQRVNSHVDSVLSTEEQDGFGDSSFTGAGLTYNHLDLG